MCYCERQISFVSSTAWFHVAAGITKMYPYIQSIDRTSKKLYSLVMVIIQIWDRNEQYFSITDIVLTRDHGTFTRRLVAQLKQVKSIDMMIRDKQKTCRLISEK